MYLIINNNKINISDFDISLTEEVNFSNTTIVNPYSVQINIPFTDESNKAFANITDLSTRLSTAASTTIYSENDAIIEDNNNIVIRTGKIIVNNIDYSKRVYICTFYDSLTSYFNKLETTKLTDLEWLRYSTETGKVLGRMSPNWDSIDLTVNKFKNIWNTNAVNFKNKTITDETDEKGMPLLEFIGTTKFKYEENSNIPYVDDVYDACMVNLDGVISGVTTSKDGYGTIDNNVIIKNFKQDYSEVITSTVGFPSTASNELIGINSLIPSEMRVNSTVPMLKLSNLFMNLINQGNMTGRIYKNSPAGFFNSAYWKTGYISLNIPEKRSVQSGTAESNFKTEKITQNSNVITINNTEWNNIRNVKNVINKSYIHLEKGYPVQLTEYAPTYAILVFKEPTTAGVRNYKIKMSVNKKLINSSNKDVLQIYSYNNTYNVVSHKIHRKTDNGYEVVPGHQAVLIPLSKNNNAGYKSFRSTAGQNVNIVTTITINEIYDVNAKIYKFTDNQFVSIDFYNYSDPDKVYYIVADETHFVWPYENGNNNTKIDLSYVDTKINIFDSIDISPKDLLISLMKQFNLRYTLSNNILTVYDYRDFYNENTKLDISDNINWKSNVKVKYNNDINKFTLSNEGNSKIFNVLSKSYLTNALYNKTEKNIKENSKIKNGIFSSSIQSGDIMYTYKLPSTATSDPKSWVKEGEIIVNLKNISPSFLNNAFTTVLFDSNYNSIEVSQGKVNFNIFSTTTSLTDTYKLKYFSFSKPTFTDIYSQYIALDHSNTNITLNYNDPASIPFNILFLRNYKLTNVPITAATSLMINMNGTECGYFDSEAWVDITLNNYNNSYPQFYNSDQSDTNFKFNEYQRYKANGTENPDFNIDPDVNIGDLTETAPDIKTYKYPTDPYYSGLLFDNTVILPLPYKFSQIFISTPTKSSLGNDYDYGDATGTKLYSNTNNEKSFNIEFPVSDVDLPTDPDARANYLSSTDKKKSYTISAWYFNDIISNSVNKDTYTLECEVLITEKMKFNRLYIIDNNLFVLTKIENNVITDDYPRKVKCTFERIVNVQCVMPGYVIL